MVSTVKNKIMAPHIFVNSCFGTLQIYLLSIPLLSRIAKFVTSFGLEYICNQWFPVSIALESMETNGNFVTQWVKSGFEIRPSNARVYLDWR